MTCPHPNPIGFLAWERPMCTIAGQERQLAEWCWRCGALGVWAEDGDTVEWFRPGVLGEMPDSGAENAPGRADIPEDDSGARDGNGRADGAVRVDDGVSGKVRYIRTAADAREMVRLYGPQWLGLVREMEEAERNPRPVPEFRVPEGSIDKFAEVVDSANGEIMKAIVGPNWQDRPHCAICDRRFTPLESNDDTCAACTPPEVEHQPDCRRESRLPVGYQRRSK